MSEIERRYLDRDAVLMCQGTCARTTYHEYHSVEQVVNPDFHRDLVRLMKKYMALDTETWLIAPGMLAPRLVCVSLAWDNAGKLDGCLLDREQGITAAEALFQDPDTIIIGQNVSYDLAVLVAEQPLLLPAVFDMYEKGRIRCTMVRQKLLDIAKGEHKFRWISKPDGSTQRVKTTHHLASLVKLHLLRDLPKKDTFRLRYSELADVPIHKWPKEAVDYAQNDAIATYEVFQAQEKLGPIANELDQTKAAWALHLMSLWGVRTDADSVRRLREKLERERESALAQLAHTGIYRADGTKDLSQIRNLCEQGFKKRDRPVPLTDGGSVATDADTLLESGDPSLKILAEAAKGEKVLTTYLPVLEQGIERPICARYNVLVESGRTSASSPNLQNPPQGMGVRECFVPRSGYLFAFADYDTLELRTLAQVCLDWGIPSEMAEALKRGEDLHTNLAAVLLGISKDEAQRRRVAGDKELKAKRDLAKILNFGYPGAMGAKTFVIHAAARGVQITLDESERLRDQWFRAWPEMQHYFQRISKMVPRYGEGTICQPRSNRIRGGVNFSSAANSPFQGLASDGAKSALFNVVLESYTDRCTALYGSRPVLFLHDEIGVEVPEDRASEAADRLAEVMISSMKKWLPDIPVSTKPVLCRRWFKGAEALRVNGRLVPVKPLEQDGKVLWIEDV